MTLEIVRSTLAWCTVIDLILLFWWFGFFVFARDFVYRMHSRWFPMPQEDFNKIHYAGMAFFNQPGNQRRIAKGSLHQKTLAQPGFQIISQHVLVEQSIQAQLFFVDHL